MLLHQYIRLDALALVLILYDRHPGRTRSWADRLGISRREEEGTQPGRQTNGALDLYIDLCVLDERIQGNWPAVEGIRIVRERKEMEQVGK